MLEKRLSFELGVELRVTGGKSGGDYELARVSDEMNAR